MYRYPSGVLSILLCAEISRNMTLSVDSFLILILLACSLREEILVKDCRRIGVGGGAEEQDCEIAEYVVSVFEKLTA